ncbi:hypothetical protein [Streptomyces hygroscopicus]|uniref:hypothetical protein n=1 Tax=Streptomyces hygroscopicus TaxID=1912 RepID=UPI000767AF6E|nr:hypothetical protein [Streptomyces hygroscopicus]
MAANPVLLRDLCAQALTERCGHDREAWEEAQAEAVQLAAAAAAKAFGQDAAAAMGQWLALEVMEDDTRQASLVLTPGAYLIYTADDSGGWFDLVTDCRLCHHTRERRVGSLEELAQALQHAGVSL